MDLKNIEMELQKDFPDHQINIIDNSIIVDGHFISSAYAMTDLTKLNTELLLKAHDIMYKSIVNSISSFLKVNLNK